MTFSDDLDKIHAYTSQFAPINPLYYWAQMFDKDYDSIRFWKWMLYAKKGELPEWLQLLHKDASSNTIDFIFVKCGMEFKSMDGFYKAISELAKSIVK